MMPRPPSLPPAIGAASSSNYLLGSFCTIFFAVTTAMMTTASEAFVTMRPFSSPVRTTALPHPHRSSSSSGNVPTATVHAAPPRSAMKMGWFDSDSTSTTTAATTTMRITDEVGSGSYGTVKMCEVPSSDDDDANKAVVEGGSKTKACIAKRPWTVDDLRSLTTASTSSSSSSGSRGSTDENSDNNSNDETEKEREQKLKERAKRCKHYFDVEVHCLTKLKGVEGVPQLLGVFRNDVDGASKGEEQQGEGGGEQQQQHEWMVFEPTLRHNDDEGTNPKPARSLAEVLELEWDDQHQPESPSRRHHLHDVRVEMGLPDDDTTESSEFENTLDVFFEQLLQILSDVHDKNVVHRDVKPANLLLDGARQSLVLIDFGSAADLDPTKNSGLLSRTGGRIGLEGNDDVVALSPIYAAPETFVRWDRAPLTFDTFSASLVFCQLLFNLLDERTDAGFRQQLDEAGYDLDLWLERELEFATLRPRGFDEALTYLGMRRGLWQLLKDMLRPNPERRPSSLSALKRFRTILSNARNGVVVEKEDGSYFESVLSSLELCLVPDDVDDEGATMTGGGPSPPLDVAASAKDATVAEAVTAEAALVVPRPLHFVATFDRSAPLGLVLSEAATADDVDDDEEEDGEDEETRKAWERATRGARPGDVFVRGIGDGGQADDMGIFEIGDRLRAVGELPVAEGGFERVVDMLGRQPQSAKTVTLHFDRLSRGITKTSPKAAPHLAKVVGQGAWSSLGRRKAQEDAFVLHEIHDKLGNEVLLAGVFDGHGGKAASTSVSQLLPSLFAAELSYTTGGLSTSSDMMEALMSSWELTCNSYRNGCDANGECVADYDPREGILLASTGSKDLIAGTTAAAAILSVGDDGADELTILNCGDSRTLVIGCPIGSPPDSKLHHESVVHFCTRDHSPKDPKEAERLRKGKEAGLDYSIPQCSLSRWWISVGDYQYAVSRSLEGTFATSKGIVSDADVTTLSLANMLSERESCILVIASDGLFEVMDNEQVGRELLSMRNAGISAADAAKNMCALAINKGTPDNVSVVAIYLE